MSIKEENALIAKGVRWGVQAAMEVQKAGGWSPIVIEMFPDELLATMVRNRLGIKHVPGVIE